MVSFLFDTPTGMSDNGFRLLGVIVWMAIWWISEVVPIAVTALLPIVLFPSCEIMSIQETGANYGHKYIFLFIYVEAIALIKNKNYSIQYKM